jgi:hypothetical protein
MTTEGRPADAALLAGLLQAGLGVRRPGAARLPGDAAAATGVVVSAKRWCSAIDLSALRRAPRINGREAGLWVSGSLFRCCFSSRYGIPPRSPRLEGRRIITTLLNGLPGHRMRDPVRRDRRFIRNTRTIRGTAAIGLTRGRPCARGSRPPVPFSCRESRLSDHLEANVRDGAGSTRTVK